MLSDTRHLRRASAYYLAGRALYALCRLNERRSIGIESPDVVLSEASAIAAHSLADFLSGDKGKRGLAAPILRSILAGMCAIETAHASTQEWEALPYKLRNEPALLDLLGDAKMFVAGHRNEIVRLANSLLELKTVSTGQIEWLLDSRTRAQVA
jgi:hypothetical protein